MNNEAVYHTPQSEDSDVMIGNSRFRDDVWDLSPLMPKKSEPKSCKKMKFDRIISPLLKLTVKQYMYYKLGQVKARTAVTGIHQLSHFLRFCEINSVHSLDKITTQTLLTFALWLKSERGLSKKTSWMAFFTVEDMIRVGQIKGWLVPSEDMRDLEKSNEVKWHLQAIQNAVESYETDAHPIYFDYDGVITLLEQAEMLMNESARCPRPADLPPEMPWCARLAGGDEVFDPYVSDGTMSAEDYERMHELMVLDAESEGVER